MLGHSNDGTLDPICRQHLPDEVKDENHHDGQSADTVEFRQVSAQVQTWAGTPLDNGAWHRIARRVHERLPGNRACRSVLRTHARPGFIAYSSKIDARVSGRLNLWGCCDTMGASATQAAFSSLKSSLK